MGTMSMTVKVLATSWLYVLVVVALPTVNIKNGTLEGSIIITRHGREISAFQGIPYALPPVGELRFQLPKPANAWKGVRPVKKDGSMCVQRDFITKGDISGSEDCLFINVYTPNLSNSETKYPVMVWFHGGGWYGGSGYSKLYGPKYLLDYDFVLVTVNYRLGSLGFLSTEDMVLPGNLGMKDQVQSLRWVQENIAEFGGDPNSVTIFGESAGAVSVHYHMVSPLSKGLFHRAISQSGTAHCSWALAKPGEAKNVASRLAKMINCSSATSAELLACLLKKTAAEIIEHDIKFKTFGIDPLITFKPVVEPDHPDAFLKEDPIVSLRNGNVTDVPWLTGINSHEGSLRVIQLFGPKETNSISMLNEKWLELAPMSLSFDKTFPEKIHDEVSKKIRQFYFGNKDIDRSLKSELINMYSDAWFNSGVQDSVKTHLQTLKSPVYYYHFSYRGRYSYSNLYNYYLEDFGVCHADEIQYLFPIGVKLFFDLIELPISTEDNNMIDVMTNMWYNFAKTGNPTPEITEKLTAKWMPVQSNELEYFEIGNSKNLSMSKNLNSKRAAFWEHLLQLEDVILLNDNIKDEL